MAGAFKTYKQASKAGKPKHRKWDCQQRFSAGHDAACLSLLSEFEISKRKNISGRRKAAKAQRIGVFRASTFGLSREERIANDAAYLLAAGRATDNYS
jgi:hypothetical protein